ncbi:hypothetical protein AAE478_007763 [Parahypoxylon ruwenzoriense]
MHTDLAWLAQAFRPGVVPAEVWNIISWIAFFFKLASLAFFVPFLGLIVFDFCLWVWRLNRPVPRDTSRPNRISRKVSEQRTSMVTSSNSVGSTTALNASQAAGQRPTVRRGHTGD